MNDAASLRHPAPAGSMTRMRMSPRTIARSLVFVGVLAGCSSSAPLTAVGGSGGTGGTAGTGGSGGMGGAAGGRDGASIDGSGPDAVTVEEDAGPDATEPDGIGSGPYDCLPDGSGHLVLETTGGLTLHVEQGNDAFCAGSAGAMSNVAIDWVVPLPGSTARVSFNADIAKLTKGKTGTGLSVDLSVLSPYPVANIWNASDCTADITTNALSMTVAGEDRYKVSGAIHCPTPIPGINMGALTITKLEFTTRVVF
jgi:hypothetical protein